MRFFITVECHASFEDSTVESVRDSLNTEEKLFDFLKRAAKEESLSMELFVGDCDNLASYPFNV